MRGTGTKRQQRQRQRQGRSSGMGVLILAGLLGLAGWLYLWLPGWWDYQEVREIARLSVTAWHVSEDRAAARDRYVRELEAREMPYTIPDDACTFEEGAAGVRRMICTWQDDITIPVVEHVVPRTYTFTTEISQAGKVRQHPGRPRSG